MAREHRESIEGRGELPEGVVPAGEEAQPGEQRAERGPRGERGERRDRRERGERGERRGERASREGAPAEEADALAGAAGSVGTVTESPEAQLPPGADPVLESHTHFDDRRPEGDTGERRDRRSRDRYGRDRRERGDRAADAMVATGAEVSPAETEVFAGHAPLPQEHHAGTAQPAPAPAKAATPEPVRARAVPRVQPFQLPVDDLKNVAEGSGLQWVLSDAEKIAAAQAAIAAEPKPVHVPRERPPVVAVDEGPLVLVETRRDLKNLELPF
jgi:ribonuclease E